MEAVPSVKPLFQNVLYAGLFSCTTNTTIAEPATALACQLCATGTIAAAAVGFAFGHPLQSDAMTRQARKRRATANEYSNQNDTPERSALSTLQHPNSAPHIKASSRTSNDDGPSLSIRPTQPARLSQPSRDAIQETRLHENVHTPQPRKERVDYRSRQSLQADFRGLENIKPSYFKHKSMESFPRTESSVLSTPPPSSSFSQSNSSTAPMLPMYGNFTPPISRNKLVKRSSSQRMLNGSQTMHSTLRRPATSHQRSATIQQRYSLEGNTGLRDSKPNSIDLMSTDQPLHDDGASDWGPFFQSQVTRPSRLGSSGKRKFPGSGAAQSLPPTIVPDLTELPTLLMATSIKARAIEPHDERRGSDASRLSRPFTPSGLSFPAVTPQSKNMANEDTTEVRPRTSFSFSEVFPSPSPLTWKMPRAGSLRGKAILGKNASNRRVVSAPQSTQSQNPHAKGNDQPIKMGNHTLIYASSSPHARLSKSDRSQGLSQHVQPSPLPPLHRLSTFKLNLPETIPSYPTTPGRKESPTRPVNQEGSTPPSPFGYRPSIRDGHPTAQPPSTKPLKRPGSDASIRPSRSKTSDAPPPQADHPKATNGRHTRNDKPRPKRRLFEKAFHGTNKAIASAPIPDQHSNLSSETTNESKGPWHGGIHSDTNNTTSRHASGRSVFRFGDHQPSPQHLISSSAHEMHESGSTTPIDAKELLEQADGSHQKSVKEGFSTPGKSSSPQDTNDVDFGPELALRPRRSTSRRRRDSPPSGAPRKNPFEWSEQSIVDREGGQRESVRPKTVQGEQTNGLRIHRLNTRRGPPPLHLRSQSVPVPSENRTHTSTVKLDSWALGKHVSSEDWSGDFDFEEPPRTQVPIGEGMRASLSSGMLVPKSILENQANVHGQFGQVRELTKLVEELKRLQLQGRQHGILTGQAAELWKEAEGIISLATVDDADQDFLPPRSPSAEFDVFEEDSPQNRRRKVDLTPTKDVQAQIDRSGPTTTSSTSSKETSALGSPAQNGGIRKDSTAKAKSVLDHIYQQRSNNDHSSVDAGLVQRKLPFDTTSLKDLVTRAGVVTRALKEEIRKAANRGQRPTSIVEDHPGTPPDPPFSQNLFQKPLPSPQTGKPLQPAPSPRSPKSPKNARSNRLGGSLSGNESEINRHMKIMTVV